MALAVSLALFLVFLFPIYSLVQGVEFLFNGFNGSESNLTLEGASIVKPSGMIRLTNKSHDIIGHAFYDKPINMFDKNNSSNPNASFSTHFVFAIVSSSPGKGGFGLAFTLAPSPRFPGAEPGHFLGIVNSKNDNSSSNHIFAVEFDTVNGFKENSNTAGNHVGININSVYSVASEPAAYFVAGAHKEEMDLESGDLIQAWIDYDGKTQIVNVTIAPIDKNKPEKPLLSHHVMDGMPSQLNISQLPNPPKEKSSSSGKPQIKALIVALSVAVFVLTPPNAVNEHLYIIPLSLGQLIAKCLKKSQFPIGRVVYLCCCLGPQLRTDNSLKTLTNSSPSPSSHSSATLRSFDLLQSAISQLKTSMALAVSLALFLVFLFPICSLVQGVEFLFNGFNGSESNLTLEGASIVKPSGMIRLTNKSHDIIGHAFYDKPINMFDKNSSSYPNASFSTHFVFAIVSSSPGKGGFGLAFTLAPSPRFPGAEPGHFLGIVNSKNDNSSSNHIFAVEFDTVNGFKENSNTAGNHVGININSVYSVASEPAAYFVAGAHKEEMDLESGDLIQAWIDYDGKTQIVNVTIAWSFAVDGMPSQLNLSQLPNPPKEKSSSSYKPQIKALIVALSVVVFVLLGILFFFTLYRKMVGFESESLEDWELDCPHRFKYKDLHAATKGFKASGVIGAGGFGEVYKGDLASTGCEIAVKKITRNSIQGMREFAAEIESLGRLRHKNLVHLLGWCKKKNNLLIVYDYIPYGSLDTLVFEPRGNFVLSWEQRFNILKGIASGLLYLHEEWEQVVIHRDVKSSNVLIDVDMNPRLSDFGLARLYDHGEISHTTGVVGTIGYIAPELARTGKASTCSDVFAYGVLLLEVACGQRPIGSGEFILADWVMEKHKEDRILETVDPNLDSNYVVKEMKLVLELGLICSHYKPDARPTMRQVVRYLHEDEELPEIDNWSIVDSGRISETNARFMQLLSTDTITSYQSSSVGGISCSSMSGGR
ncbi:PREDICTED: lectin-domain containing receptor kinase VI.3-like [Prunus mume]|uniref:Lectin-domain containing receptor kinase VI.3-like n=1 Tax=Prunus mume TaxID=102107 RepID=A0ABM0PST5_PRUMU|nr:PREDICTED: lectin-domain containing receptor kinase VI.3-like [Prunus mume]